MICSSSSSNWFKAYISSCLCILCLISWQCHVNSDTEYIVQKVVKRCDAIIITGDLRKKLTKQKYCRAKYGKICDGIKMWEAWCQRPKICKANNREKKSDQKICWAKIDFGKKRCEGISIKMRESLGRNLCNHPRCLQVAARPHIIANKF